MSETSLFHDGASISSGGSINLFLFSRKSCPTFGNPVDCNTPGFPCPSSFPGVCPSSCQLIQWCHPTISFSVVPFSSLPSILPASKSFPMNRLFPSGHSIGASAAASVLRMNIPGWFPSGLTGLISFWLKNLLQNHNSKPSSLWHVAFFMIQLSHPYMTAGKTTALTIWTLTNLTLKRLSPEFCHVDQY